MVFTKGLTEPDPKKWKFGDRLQQGAPTWDFLWRQISVGEDVEIAFTDEDVAKPTFDHAVTLVGLSFDDKNGNGEFDAGETQRITYLDPNDPTKLLTASLTTSDVLFGGSLEFHYDSANIDVGIYLAYSESPDRTLAVPEPTSFILVGFGAVFLLAYRWMPRRQTLRA
jgi:hypothetical protein